jgi:hypothetical protein
MNLSLLQIVLIMLLIVLGLVAYSRKARRL